MEVIKRSIGGDQTIAWVLRQYKRRLQVNLCRCCVPSPVNPISGSEMTISRSIMADHTMLVCAVIITALFAFASTLVSGQSENDLPLGGKSFSVRSLVSTTIYEGGQVVVGQLREQYSVEQSRARIDFVRDNKVTKEDRYPAKGKIIYSAHTDTALLVGNFDGHCRNSSRAEIFRLLHGIGPEEFENKLGNLAEFGGQFVVGSAKWIFFIAKHRNELKPFNVGDVKVKVRNIPSVLFELNFNSAYNFTIYFSDTNQAHWDAQLPSRILILAKDFNIAIDYLIYQQENLKSAQLVEQLTVGQPPFEALLDPFNFGQFPGCSSQIRDQMRRSNYLLPRAPNWSRFSFRAKVNLVKGTVGTYIAADSYLDIMRLDITTTPIGVTGVRKQVFDFAQNRMYHAMQFVDSDRSLSEVNRVLKLSDRFTQRQLKEEGYDRSAIMQCMTSPILPPNKWSTSGSQSNLMGSFDKLLPNVEGFLYVGLARVGGIEAHVFEAYKGLIPFWIDQTLSYKTVDGEFKVRFPDAGVKSDPDRVSTILAYFGSENGGSQANKLLLVEVYALYEDVLHVVDKQSILIEDFTWDLEGAPNGDQVDRLFSLEGLCSATGPGTNEYAKVDLILEDASSGAEQSEAISLAVSRERNLALLTGLQRDFNLPVTMIYDLQSTYLARQGKHFVAGSFKIAKHQNELVELIYLGQGRLLDADPGKFVSVFIRSFQACFFMAAHRGRNVYFGYQNKLRICHISLEPVSSIGGANRAAGFEIGKFRHNSAEVYQTNHVSDETIDDKTNWIALAINRPHERIKFLGKRISLVEAESNKQSPMIVKRLRVEDSAYRNSVTHKQVLNNQGNVSEQILRINKIPGFGLSDEDRRLNRVFEPARKLTPPDDDLIDADSSANYEQCHLACIGDFTCKSFSVCVRDSGTQCVLSRASFRSAELVQQLVEMRDSSRGGREFKVQLTLEGDLGDIGLIQYPNCDLYNKNFLDLFKSPFEAQKTFSRRRLYQVENREHCAQLCATQSLTVVEKTSKTLAQLNNDHLSGEARDWRADLGELCRAFLYLDKSIDIPKSVRSNITARLYPLERSSTGYGDATDKQVNEDLFEGYCMLNERASEREASQLIESDRLYRGGPNVYLEFEVFAFKTEFFYEKQYGVRLLDSRKTGEELIAYELIRKNSPRSTQADYALMEAFMKRGENSQSINQAHAELCAHTCLMQSWEKIWPACRSFDIVSSIDSGSQIYYCYLNSVTLAQVKALGRLDLIEANTTTNVQMWHYEPKSGIEGFRRDHWGNRTEPISSDSYRFHSFAMLFLALLGIVSGLKVGVELARYMIINNRSSQVSVDPLTRLIEQIRS